MITSLEPDVPMLPGDWPGPDHKGPRPGDLSRFVPQGLGLAAPMIIRPYGGLPEPHFYGSQDTITHPVKSAPVNDSAGGVIYFDGYSENDRVLSALALMGGHTLMKDYAVFISSSDDVGEDRYLDQMRIIGRGALQNFYGITADKLPEQKFEAGAAIARFLDWQRDKWHRSGLSGTLGGDGDWAKESLAFGLMVENSYWGVIRVWSRPWLVTK